MANRSCTTWARSELRIDVPLPPKANDRRPSRRGGRQAARGRQNRAARKTLTRLEQLRLEQEERGEAPAKK